MSATTALRVPSCGPTTQTSDIGLGKYEYDRIARAYDEHFGKDACQRLRSVYLSILTGRVSECASILDLCCGTGHMAQVLTQEGFEVTGVDQSAGMLEVARERCGAAHFVQADASSFQFGPVDAVICTFNSVSHFSQADLHVLFVRTAANLSAGGAFIFDAYGPAAYEEQWNRTYSVVEEDYACFVRSYYHPQDRTGRNDIHLFEKSPDGWQRRRVSLEMHAHSPTLLRKLLASCGFRTRVIDLSSEVPEGGESGHLLYFCKKVRVLRPSRVEHDASE
jgi:SAM-dependent methyltransferase